MTTLHAPEPDNSGSNLRNTTNFFFFPLWRPSGLARVSVQDQSGPGFFPQGKWGTEREAYHRRDKKNLWIYISAALFQIMHFIWTNLHLLLWVC